ncbi:MAG: DoxX family protein [Flavobacteriales bacterium]
MKRINILYWTVTGLFTGFMISTAIPDIVKQPEAMQFIQALGYPDYFIPFIGVAKVLGAIAILLPWFPRLKEWAYAGLFFDLIGALYSLIALYGFKLDVMMMVLFIGVLFLSYFLMHKRERMKRALSQSIR